MPPCIHTSIHLVALPSSRSDGTLCLRTESAKFWNFRCISAALEGRQTAVGLLAFGQSDRDAEEFESLLRQYEKPIYRVAYRLTGDADEAEDLIQESALDAYRSFHQFERGTRFDRWFFRVMSNNYIDLARKRGKTEILSLNQSGRTENEEDTTTEIADLSMNPEQQVLDGVMEERMQRALAALPEEFRTAVVLCDIEGLTYEEIRDLIKRPVGTVRSRIHRGREMLRRLLTSQGGAEGRERP